MLKNRIADLIACFEAFESRKVVMIRAAREEFGALQGTSVNSTPPRLIHSGSQNQASIINFEACK